MQRLWQHQAACSSSGACADTHAALSVAARALSHHDASSRGTPPPSSSPAAAGAAAACACASASAGPLLARAGPAELQQPRRRAGGAAPPPVAAGRRGIFVVVDVRNNNVDAAYGRLNRHCADNGLYGELRKRDHRWAPRLGARPRAGAN
jgi:ribosomal protein S21